MRQSRLSWSKVQDGMLIRMKREKLGAKLIGLAVNKTATQVNARWQILRATDPRAMAVLSPKKTGRPRTKKPPAPPKPKKARLKPAAALPAPGTRLDASQVETVRRLMGSMTDQQIAEVYRVEMRVVRRFRHLHGLIKPKGGCHNLRWGGIGTTLPSVDHTELPTYVDELGRTVKRCPPGFAYGASPPRSVGCKGHQE